MEDKLIREYIDDKVRKVEGTNRKPRFYVISGASLYGIEDDDSDIDIRGFHTEPTEEYAKIHTPTGQIQKIEERHGTEFDLESFELRKYGGLLHSMSFNVLEQLLCGREITNGCPLSINSLRKTVRDRLPASVAVSYRGMAKSNYEKYLNPNAEAYKPYPKKYLYVIRGLLAAEHVSYNDEIEPEIRELASQHGGEDIVDRLIEDKRSDGELCSNELATDANYFIAEKFTEDLIRETKHDREKFAQEINTIMMEIRNE